MTLFFAKCVSMTANTTIIVITAIRFFCCKGEYNNEYEEYNDNEDINVKVCIDCLVDKFVQCYDHWKTYDFMNGDFKILVKLAKDLYRQGVFTNMIPNERFHEELFLILIEKSENIQILKSKMYYSKLYCI